MGVRGSWIFPRIHEGGGGIDDDSGEFLVLPSPVQPSLAMAIPGFVADLQDHEGLRSPSVTPDI